MDPATIVALTIGGITTVSGYGAMKLNAKTKATIDEQVKLAIGDAQAKIADAQKAKTDAEQKVNTLKAYIDTIERVKKQLESEKSVLSENLEKASELEKTFRELPAEVFKQAINDFKAKPQIVTLGHPEFFEPLLSRFSVTRGTARSLYAKFKKVVNDIMPKPEFDALLLDALKNGASSLEAVKAAKDKVEAEAKAAKDKVEAEAKAAKDKIANEKAAEAQAKRDVAATEAAEIRTAALKKAFEESNIRKEEAIRVKAAKDETARLAKEAKDKATAAAAEAKAAKDKLTLQDIVDDAFKAAKDGPLTSNTLYQKVKTPFLSGIDSVARGVQKAVDVTKQAAKKTGQVIRAPLTAYEKRQADYKARKQQALEDERQALEEQAPQDELPNQQGGADTFDTDVNYRLFHPKDGDKPNKVLADLFKRTSSDETLATNIRPIVDAFIYWRKTILNFSSLYKIELVVSAENLFNLTKSNQVNAVFKDEVEKAMKQTTSKKVTTQVNPMNGGTRKKKLRTRRRDKQNVRRTRRSQNRPNRTDTYSSRRSEVDASGDELGL
jgi:hypothetical protein